MARTFGKYSPAVPLGTTWEESIVLTDSAGDVVDLTGYHARAQLRSSLDATGAPVLELTSEGADPTLTITAIDGQIDIRVPHTGVSALSPDNERLTFVWDLELFTRDGSSVVDYVIPCVSGRVTVLPRATREDFA